METPTLPTAAASTSNPSPTLTAQQLEDINQKYEAALSQSTHSAEPNLHGALAPVLDDNSPQIKQDMLRMIVQFLGDEGYQISKNTVCDETGVKQLAQMNKIQEIRRLKKAILDGEWTEVEKLCTKSLVKHQKSFLYMVFRQQFLEHIDLHEYQKAFACLNRRLKPLEYLQTTNTEFRDMCYLLTCKSVQDVLSFKSWEGIGPSREKLVEQLQHMIDYETFDKDSIPIPPHRLMTLMKQAAAYQIESSKYLPEVQPRIKSLLQDYSSFVIPNNVQNTFVGHRGSIKCAIFAGHADQLIASGASDNEIRLWDIDTKQCVNVLKGHGAKIWDLCCDSTSTMLASASGDGTVKLWNLENPSQATCVSTLGDHRGDVYSVSYHPLNTHITTGGYDKIIRLFDTHTGTLVKSFGGHDLSVSQVSFNPLGNLIVSGSKDKTIKFWDILSGICIKTISVHLGEVTSVTMNTNGSLLLSSSKDNSTRLWDVRMMKPIQKFKGHQNIAKNFIRSGFAHNSLVISGSEDGIVYLWDQDSGSIVQRLAAHQGTAYSAAWSNKRGLLCSCSDDSTVKTWNYDAAKPLVA
ncbi:WD40-repeat-containing domain protein [Dimargaris cristalligena]|uniref:WD40 repeat-containing protein SMU1 n=1 Tax=Dimargaris cristalligena TaxID=215637 RepID=A0A4Q0A0G4_9FUNG|nr:WD40-repeat-containing domain protein [Dimargaris cristalligena]|eukprot:RKP38600.1 WD40-repeat-containing domain protein [Dimargaris cristalligena]